MFFFKRTSIFYNFLYNTEVHCWLTAKEVNFKIMTVSRIGYKEIKGSLSNLCTHKFTVSFILSFFCKTIAAGKITIMRNMQAKCLYYCLSALYLFNIIFVNIFCK